MWHFIGFGTDRATIDIIRFQTHTITRKDGTVVKATSIVEVQQPSLLDDQKKTGDTGKSLSKEVKGNGEK
jgi:hypothetical protein